MEFPERECGESAYKTEGKTNSQTMQMRIEPIRF